MPTIDQQNALTAAEITDKPDIRFGVSNLQGATPASNQMSLPELGKAIGSVINKDTVAAMLAETGVVDGQQCTTARYSTSHTVGDGSGGEYVYDADSTATIDGGFVMPGIGGSLSFSGTTFDGTAGTGRWLLKDTTVADTQQFGGDHNALQRAVTKTNVLVSGDITLTADLTVNATVTLAFQDGAAIDLNGNTLTMRAKIEAGRYQIFNVNGGTMTGIPVNEEIYPEWFGAVGFERNTTLEANAPDDFEAFQDAVNWIFKNNNSGCVLSLAARVYRLSDSLDCTSALTSAGSIYGTWYGFRIKGESRVHSGIISEAEGYPAIDLTGTNRCQFRNFSIWTRSDGTLKPSCAIFAARNTSNTNGGTHSFDDVYIDGRFSKAAIATVSSESSQYDNVFINNRSAGSHSIHISEQNDLGITSKYVNLAAHVFSGGNTSHWFRGGGVTNFATGAAAAIVVKDAENVAFTDTNIYTASDIGVLLAGTVRDVSINNCRFESTSDCDWSVVADEDASITGLMIRGGRSAAPVGGLDGSTVSLSDIDFKYIGSPAPGYYGMDFYNFNNSTSKYFGLNVRIRNYALNSEVIPTSGTAQTVVLTADNDVSISGITSGVFSSTGHGFSNGDAIYITGTEMPGLVANYRPYYVINATTDTFEISATVGGAAFVPSTAGTGVTASARHSKLRGFTFGAKVTSEVYGSRPQITESNYSKHTMHKFHRVHTSGLSFNVKTSTATNGGTFQVDTTDTMHIVKLVGSVQLQPAWLQPTSQSAYGVTQGELLILVLDNSTSGVSSTVTWTQEFSGMANVTLSAGQTETLLCVRRTIGATTRYIRIN